MYVIVLYTFPELKSPFHFSFISYLNASVIVTNKTYFIRPLISLNSIPMDMREEQIDRAK